MPVVLAFSKNIAIVVFSLPRRFDRRNDPVGFVEHETRVKTAIVHGFKSDQGAMVQ